MRQRAGRPLPEMTPLLLIDSPEGRPLALYWSVPGALSVATIGRDTASPALKAWPPGSVMLIGLLTAQLKVALLE